MSLRWFTRERISKESLKCTQGTCPRAQSELQNFVYESPAARMNMWNLVRSDSQSVNILFYELQE
jgi:hypothetical protein